MDELRIYPDQGYNFQEALSLLGTQIDTIVVSSGQYGVAQGLTNLNGPSAPLDKHFEIQFEDDVVIDLGRRFWSDHFGPDGKARRFKIGRGYILEGNATVKGTSQQTLMHGGNIYCRGLTFKDDMVVETDVSTGNCEFIDCNFVNIGADPVSDDPIWHMVAQWPESLWVRVSGANCNPRDAVKRAGLEHMLPEGVEEIITDGPEWEEEHIMAFQLCKHLGYPGDGLHGLYFSGQGKTGYVVEGCLFAECSGHAVFLNTKSGVMSDVSLKNNFVSQCTSLYTVWGDVQAMVVAGNQVAVAEREFGPRRSYGFIVNGRNAPLHNGNIFTYFPGREVWGCRLWNNSPMPDMGTDKVEIKGGATSIPSQDGPPIEETKEVTQLDRIEAKLDETLKRLDGIEKTLDGGFEWTHVVQPRKTPS